MMGSHLISKSIQDSATCGKPTTSKEENVQPAHYPTKK